MKQPEGAPEPRALIEKVQFHSRISATLGSSWHLTSADAQEFAEALESALARAEAAEADRDQYRRQLQDVWQAKEIYGPPLTLGETDDGRRVRATESEIAPGKAVLIRNRTEESVEIAVGKESWWARLEERTEAAEARAEKAEAELASVIEDWPESKPRQPFVFSYGGQWFVHYPTVSANNLGPFSTKRAAVDACRGLPAEESDS